MKKRTGLSKVVSIVLGAPLCKVQQLSDWEQRPLSESQKHYAALDAYILVQILTKLGQTAKIERKPRFQRLVKTLGKF